MRLGPGKISFGRRSGKQLDRRPAARVSHRNSGHLPLSVLGLGVLSLTLERLLKVRFVLVHRYRILRYTTRRRYKSKRR